MNDHRIVRCRESKCSAPIIFLPTAAGKNMPVDAETVEPEDDTYDPSRHSSHYKTCVAPNRFSHGRKS